MFDVERKGYITCDDFYRVLKSLGDEPSDAEVLDLYREYDISGNGQVYFEELLVAIIKREEGLDELEKEFRSLDKNDDGRLDRDELAGVLTTSRRDIGSNSVDILKKYDSDKDGYVDYKEFLKLLKTR
ncbi:hypothetical protein ScPMuIL_014016 [Solemya velum]